MTDQLGTTGVGVALLYLAPSLVATIATFAVAVHLFDRSRPRDAIRAFTVALFAESIWSAGVIAELSSTSLHAKLFWDTLQLPAVCTAGVMLFLFARAYVGRPLAASLPTAALLAFLPAVAVGFVLTEPLHGRARTDAHLVAGEPFDSLVYSFSWAEVVAIVYLVALLIASAVLLLRELIRQPAAFRFQTGVLLFSVCVPLFPALFLYAGIELFGQRDAAPVFFGSSAIVVAYALSRRSTFDLVPVARDATFEHIPDAVLVVDRDDRIIDANPAAFAIFGAGSVRRSLVDVLPEVASRRSLEPSGDSAGFVEVALERDGVERVLDVRIASFRAERDGSFGRVLVFTDVTARVIAEREARNAREHLERRVAERTADLARVNEALSREVEERAAAQAALAESDQRFRAVFDQTFQLIGVLSLDGTLLRANKTALDFAGAEAADVEGLPFWETPFWSHSPELMDRLREAVREAAAGKLVRFEATHPGRDGTEHVIDFSIKPIVGVDGKPVLLVPEGRDVTEKKRADEERAQLEMQLHQAQKMESLGRLAGGIAHDFNNLLTAILGNASLIIRKTEATAPSVAYARDIVRAGESAAELTKQLLAFSRRQLIQRRSEDVGELVTHAVRLLARVVGDDVEVITDLRVPTARAYVDAGQIEQAIVNLAVNARDAMPEGGKLTIAVDVERPPSHVRERLGLPRSDDELVTLSVADTGTGMSAEVIARIFEPFFTTKPLGRGTGLGLSMVFGAMRQNDGGVDVHSRVGEGTCFKLYFPRTHDVAAAPRRKPTGVPRGAENIVVVEDQPLVRELATRWLLELGYRVRSFASAEEALSSLAPEDPIELLLTDVVLSGMSGRILAERLIADRKSMRVLYMSGYNDDVTFERSGSVSGTQLLSKPFTVEQLANAVRYRLLPMSGEIALPNDTVSGSDSRELAAGSRTPADDSRSG